MGAQLYYSETPIFLGLYDSMTPMPQMPRKKQEGGSNVSWS